MNVAIRVSAPLRAYCRGAPAEIRVSAATVREALDRLRAGHPDLHRAVLDETGTLRRHVGLFVNDAHVRDKDGLDTELAEGDVLTILPAVSGG